MKLTKIFAVGAMLLFGAVAANAQPGMGGPGGPGGPGEFNPEEMVKMRADRMKEELKLNDDQYQKVLAIYKAENEEMMKMMQEGPQGGQPDMEAFQKRRDAQKAEFKKILTEEQYKQYEEMEAQRGPGMGGPGGPGGPGMGGPGGPGMGPRQ